MSHLRFERYLWLESHLKVLKFDGFQDLRVLQNRKIFKNMYSKVFKSFASIKCFLAGKTFQYLFRIFKEASVEKFKDAKI